MLLLKVSAGRILTCCSYWFHYLGWYTNQVISIPDITNMYLQILGMRINVHSLSIKQTLHQKLKSKTTFAIKSFFWLDLYICVYITKHSSFFRKKNNIKNIICSNYCKRDIASQSWNLVYTVRLQKRNVSQYRSSHKWRGQ